MENKMKTPCEKLGYKVGDKFEVVIEDYFSKGSVVELYEDEGSMCPLFKLISGSCGCNNLPDGTAGAYEMLSYMKKLEGQTEDAQRDNKDMKPESETQDTVWLQLASLERFARSCNYTYSQGGFYYFGGNLNGEDRVSLELIQALHNKCTQNKIVKKAYLQYNKKQRKLQATKHIVKLV